MSDDFLTPEIVRENEQTLDELYNEVSAYQGTLAGGEKIDLAEKPNALLAFKQTQVSFGNPYDRLVKLTPALFEGTGGKLDDVLTSQMQTSYDFYYMTLNVSMRPQEDVQFSRVECQLNFSIDGKDSVIVQTLFPSSEWKEVIQWGGEVNLGVTGSLGFDLGVSVDKTTLPVQVQAKVKNSNELNSFIAVPKFTFSMGRSDIEATGEGNSFAFWRIRKPELKQTQTAKFGVIFKVPKGSTTLGLEAIAAVAPSIPWLTANLSSVIRFLSAPFKALFTKPEAEQEKSLSKVASEKWVLNLPA